MTRMNVVVTGATGFTGTNLTMRLLEEGYAVRVLVRDASAAGELDKAGAEIHVGDIRDPEAVDRAVAGSDQVFHLAACYRDAGHREQYYREVNVDGTRNVLDAARRHDCERVVHCSTIGVHGSVDRSAPADEDAPFAPGDIYQQTKLEGEQLARAAQRRGQPVAIFRPAGIYGPGDKRFLKLFRLVRKRRFLIFGSGEVHMHLVYIDDLLDGILLCARRPEALGDVFILCGPESVSVNELVRLVAKAVGTRPLKLHLPFGPLLMSARVVEAICVPLGINPPLHVRRAELFVKHRSFSHEKATRLLDYEPRVPTEEGIVRTAGSYVEDGLLPPAV